MMTYEEIIDNCTKYKIENGQVIDKSTNQVIIDEDIILRVKSSVLLFKDAKERYQEDVKQFGSTSLTQEQYIRRTMERFSVNGEQNNFGINKLINTILSSNGHYEEFMSGKEVQNSKFSILIPPQREYGLAFLKIKFREKGLDIEDLQVRQDLSEFQKNGVSKIIIDYKVKEYKKEIAKSEENNMSNQYRHPKYAELNALESKKQQAKQSNDRAAYDNAQAEIEKIIRSSRLEVTPQEWDSMNIEQQISFVKVKLQEAQTLKDEDEYNYWNANLRYLEEKLISSKTQSEQQVVSSKQDTYVYYYQEMMNAVKRFTPTMSENEKKQTIGEIFYNEGYMIDRLKSDNELRDLMTMIVNNLGNNDMEKRLSNIILTEIQEKYKQLHPEKQNQVKPESSQQAIQHPVQSAHQPSNNRIDLSFMIKQLRKQLIRIQDEYHTMMSDGYIDDKELASLTKMIKEVTSDAYSLKEMATEQSDIQMISAIISSLEEEQSKMKEIQEGIDNINRNKL